MKAGQLNQIEDLITQDMERWQVPGAAVAIIKERDAIFSKGFGYRDREQKLPVTPDTLFAIASCSKAFTAMTIGMLVDNGKLAWNKPVRDYLPEFRLYDPFASERLTPRDLLCHNSGLPRHDLVWYHSAATRPELLRRLRYLEPSKDFRAAWQYQNIMYMVAGYLVERLTGVTWEKFTQQHIFDVLGMKSSRFSPSVGQNIALPYEEKDGEIIRLPYYDNQLLGPAGAIYSNLTDLAKWAAVQLNRGTYNGIGLVKEETFRFITDSHMVVDDPTRNELIQSDFYNYGLGWSMHPYHGHKLLFHGGAIDGFTSRVAWMPTKRIAIVVLNNLEDSPLPVTLTYSLFDVLLGHKPQPWSDRVQALRAKAEADRAQARQAFEAARLPNASPTHSLDAFTGEYEHPGYGRMSIIIENDRLYAIYNTMKWALEHYHYDVFEVKFKGFRDRIVTATFRTGTTGHIQSIGIPMQEGVGDILFTRVDN